MTKIESKKMGICPFMKSPMDNCYCRNLSSENIEKAHDFCSGDYESCVIYQGVFRVDDAINDCDESVASPAVIGLSTGSERNAQLQMRQKLLLKMLELLGKNTHATTMYRDFVLLLRHFTAVDDVALYLVDSENQSNNRIVGCQGDVVTDEQQSGRLKCLCGNIVDGDMASTSLNKTTGGVYWSNDFESLSAAEVAALSVCISARCPDNKGGSVVLLPVCYRGKAIGVLRIHDKRKGLFTRDDIQFLEGVAVGLGIVVIQSRADESRIYSEMFIDSVQNPIMIVDSNLVLRKVNKKFCQNVSLAHDDVLGRTLEAILGHDIYDSIFSSLVKQALCGERTQSTNFVAFPGRDAVCYLITCQPHFSASGVVDAINMCMHEEINGPSEI